ncbi:MAG: LysM peptidoglycan-binding domain-containing protein [Spirochaetota bacterium]
MHVNKNVVVLAVVVCLSMITACFEKVPVKELSLAKNAITEAESVKADHYAKDEYTAAKDLLLKAHDNVKNEEYDKAKQNAIDSQKKAKEAYDKALPLLAKDTLDIAAQSLQAADDAYASVLAKEDYAKASDMLQEANKQYENKNYLAAYKAALDADVYAKNARNVAMNQKETLADSIKEVNIVIAQAEGYGAAQYAPEKLALAKEHSQVARSAYDAGELKKGFSAIEVAKLNADDAYFVSLKATAARKIEEAQAAIDAAKGSEAAKLSPNDIKAAEESLAQAKSLFNDAKYKESMIASGQAISIAQGVSSKKAVAVAPVPVTEEQGKEGVGVKEEQKEAIQKKVEEETEYTLYKVKYNPAKRDCLWRIAEKFYNDGFKWKVIYEANRDKVKNPNLIKPGWTLKIPKAATKLTQPVQEENKEAIKEDEPPATELKMKTE